MQSHHTDKAGDGFHVVTDEDSVYLMEGGDELVMWTAAEWSDDPALVFSIINAVRIGYTDGPEAVRHILNTTNLR